MDNEEPSYNTTPTSNTPYVKPSSGSKALVVVLVAVVAMLAGGLVGYMLGDRTKNEENMQTSAPVSATTEAANLRVTMNNLLREHVTTNLEVTYNIVSQAPEAKLKGSIDAQTANATAIANAVGAIYGDDAKNAITTPFVAHLTASNNYARAVQAGNENAKTASLEALQTSLREVATVFNSVIPSISVDTLYNALNEHEMLMNDIAREAQSGDYARAYELEAQALTQISAGADVLTNGIIESKPDMFNK